jgi:class 3 adenylate cyclase/pimeloyl-ACP methyl ester carboxylesterase
MQCSQCQHENPAGARYCNACGAKLAMACPACTHVNPSGSRFCNACGQNLLALAPQLALPETPPATQVKPPPPAPGTPDAERRQLTVMFADVVDSTQLSGQLDPEDYRDVLRAYQSTCAEVIHQFDGYIAQHLGDGLLIYFGYPQAYEDEAQRAIRAGLGMLEAVQTLNTRLEWDKSIRLAIRVGIHTGLTVIGDIGGGPKHELLALGEAPNIAARIEGIAEPNTVAISGVTYRLVRGYFACDDLGFHTPKGVSTSVQVYRVLRESGAQSRLDIAMTTGLTPLVGRERELALLQDRFAEVQAHCGQAVFVFGEAGIGKSRLLHEFRRQVEATGVRWLVGRCISYGHGIAYLPILDVVRDLIGIQEADDVATILAKLETGVRRVGADLSWTVPFLRILLSLDPGDPEVTTMVPAQRRGRTVETLRTLLIGASQHQPVVVFVEDLHWIDPHSEEVIRLLLEGIAAVPVLVLLTHRPGYTPPVGDQTYYSRITLHRLSDAQMRAMVERVLQSADVPASVLELIARRAEGNPLFIEELCKALVEDGTLERVNNGYRLTRPFHEAAIPSTVQGVITARMDRLSETAKTALQIASVIGREFTVRLLERVAGMERGAVQISGELRAVELIYEKTLFPELVYMFKHALTHDVAYESQLRQRRKELHRRVGEVIEDLYAERLPEFYTTLAWHYVQGETWPKAVDYLLKAADQARARFAYPEATRHCTDALTILQHSGGEPAITLRAFESLGDLQSLQGHIEEANQAYNRALEVAETIMAHQRVANKLHHPGTVTRNGSTIAYYTHGSTGPPVVLMHPAAYGIGSFQPLLELLCQEFRIITIDPRGLGASDPLPEAYRVHDHVEDIRTVIETVVHLPVVLVGYSRSAAIAIQCTALYPHLCAKLIVGGSRPSRAPDAPGQAIPAWRKEFTACVRAGNYERAMRLFAAQAHSEPGSHNLIETLISLRGQLPRDIYQRFYTSDIDDPGLELRPILPTLRVPTLVLHGEEDRIAPLEGGRYMAAHIPDAQFYTFKGRGHGLVWTATGEFVQVVREFIQTGRVT